jgi:hypothetical protein
MAAGLKQKGKNLVGNPARRAFCRESYPGDSHALFKAFRPIREVVYTRGWKRPNSTPVEIFIHLNNKSTRLQLPLPQLHWLRYEEVNLARTMLFK